MHSPSAICQAHLGKRGDRHHGSKGPKEAVESVCQDSPLDVLVKLIACKMNGPGLGNVSLLLTVHSFGEGRLMRHVRGRIN
jgi:hypothetical protein